eukprot:350919-Chlamydomonas_euryale.AAC.4
MRCAAPPEAPRRAGVAVGASAPAAGSRFNTTRRPTSCAAWHAAADTSVIFRKPGEVSTQGPPAGKRRLTASRMHDSHECMHAYVHACMHGWTHAGSTACMCVHACECTHAHACAPACQHCMR